MTQKMKTDLSHTSSFRDPSGFLFQLDGKLYRQVNQIYQAQYDHLMDSGLYKKLSGMGILVSHQSVQIDPLVAETGYLVIQPDIIPLITYPYEWCFNQLKDAALLTLYIAREALQAGMVLKDASAYNVQFRGAFPIFIDSLSFDIYQEGKPWDAYRQFCQHFLAPLALMAYRDVRLAQLLQSNIDGVPLDLASILLPWRTKLNTGLLTHIHLHATAQNRYADRESGVKTDPHKFSLFAFQALIDNLENTIKKLTLRHGSTEWADYYDNTNYDETAFRSKTEIVKGMLDKVGPGEVWDLGANNGVFSRLASEKAMYTVAWDIDPNAVEANYQKTKKEKNRRLLPLVLDLFNPSPAIGWHNSERDSLVDRAPVHTLMALALVHHLAISNNLPLQKVCEFFGQIGQWAIVEFVPKSDSQVKRLLATREDIFPKYTEEDFEEAAKTHFDIIESASVNGSQRTMYLLKNKHTLYGSQVQKSNR
jgi:hypothetical protein